MPTPSANAGAGGPPGGQRHLLRYALAIVGPIGVAGSQFLVSLAMVHLLPPQGFGSFSFLMVANVLSWGICSALFCAPLPLLLYQKVEGFTRDGEAMLVAASAGFALLYALVSAGIAAALGLDGPQILLFTVYAWASFSRYFARSHALARHDQLKATLSDVAFSGALTLGIGAAIWRGGDSSGTAIYAALMLAAIAGLLPFGPRYIVGELLRIRPTAMQGYGFIWRRMSAWSVLGVVTTEATNNAHAYLITAVLGPAALAPLAASMLVTRPVAVISTALSDFERPRLARQIGEMRFTELRQSIRLFRWAIAAAWALTALAVAAVFLLAPHLIFPPRYDIGYIALGSTLWMIVSAARLAAIPPSCVLIAKGSFRLLAMTSVWTGLVALLVVGGMIALFDVMWSILGILFGVSLYALLLQFHASRWISAQRDGIDTNGAHS